MQSDRTKAANTSDDEIDQLNKQLRNHPCHSCPDREAHARWAERYFRTLRDKDRLVGEIERATGSIARIFDKRIAILPSWATSRAEHTPTAAGETMRKLYAENDLVIAECLRTGVWEQLHGPALAAAVSTLLYNGRREDENRTPRVPGGPQGVLGVRWRRPRACGRASTTSTPNMGSPNCRARSGESLVPSTAGRRAAASPRCSAGPRLRLETWCAGASRSSTRSIRSPKRPSSPNIRNAAHQAISRHAQGRRCVLNASRDRRLCSCHC